MADLKLTPKQRRFVEIFDGNATSAARLAGYKGNDGTLAVMGSENLRKPQILEAIRSRESLLQKPEVCNRETRQKFWSSIMIDESKDLRDRLRASELLAKSEGDFIQKINLSDTDGLYEKISAARARIADKRKSEP